MDRPQRSPATGGSRLPALAAAGLLLIACLLALLRVTTFESVGAVRLSAADWVMSDFKTIVYYPARAFLEGANPYDTERYLARYPAPEGFRLYPPALFILAAPVAALPLGWAIVLNVGLTLALTTALAVMSLRLAGARGRLPAVLLVTAIILLSRPGQWNLLQGQITIPLVLSAYAALVLDRRRALLAGCALALCLVKPNFGLPLSVIMLARGQVRPVVLGLALAAAFNLPLVAVLAERAGGVMTLVEQVTGARATLSRTADLDSELSVFRIDGVALVTRLAPGLPGLLVSLLVAVLVIGLVALALRRRRTSRYQPDEPGPTWAESGLICSGILLCGYHIGYDLLLLAWPAVALALRIVATRTDTPVREWLALGLFAVLAGNYLTSFAIIEALRNTIGLPPVLSLALASLNGLALLLLFGLYLYEVTRVRPSVRSVDSPPRVPTAEVRGLAGIHGARPVN
jgi:hypothetical protein